MEGSDSWGTRKENFPLPPVLSPLWQRRDVSLIWKEGRAEDSLCLSLFSGAAWLPHGLSLCLSPTFGTLFRVPCGMLRWCCAGGQQGTSAGRDQCGGGRDEMDGAHRWASQREVEKEKRKRTEEAKREESQRRLGGIKGQEWGGQGIVSSPWVSINSCLGVGLCALCFSSYCLGIPVGTLPAPMLRSRHHPNRSDQRQRGTSAG